MITTPIYQPFVLDYLDELVQER